MEIDALKDFVLSGRMMDLVLLLVLIEAACLIAYRRLTLRGPSPLDTVANLASGIFLMIGLRLALTHSHWLLIVAALTAAFFAHLYDLCRRWPKADRA